MPSHAMPQLFQKSWCFAFIHSSYRQELSAMPWVVKHWQVFCRHWLMKASSGTIPLHWFNGGYLHGQEKRYRTTKNLLFWRESVSWTVSVNVFSMFITMRLHNYEYLNFIGVSNNANYVHDFIIIQKIFLKTGLFHMLLKLFHEKNQKSKISWHCPLKKKANIGSLSAIIVAKISFVKKEVCENMKKKVSI